MDKYRGPAVPLIPTEMGRARVSDEVEIVFEDSGGDGEPLVLIMGIGAQLIHWPQGLVQLLIKRGYRVIRFDHRDVGLSTKFDNEPRVDVRKLIARALFRRSITASYTLSDMALDVAGLMDHVGLDSAHIAGVSMGGMLAQTFAIDFPSRTRSLTSVMSHTGSFRYLLSRPDALLSLLQKAPTNREEAVANALHFYDKVGSTGFVPDIEDLRQRAALGYERMFYPRGFLRHMAAILASGSREQALGSLRVPAMVVHGSVDPLIRPAGGRATAAAIPGAQLRIVPGMGHDLPPGVWHILVDAIDEVAAVAPS